MKVKLTELDQYAREFVKTLKESPNSSVATVLALYGDLGAGKTTLTQAISRELGISEDVTSPTFVIEKIYELEGQEPFSKLIHIDAYRLESAKELENLGWEDVTSDSRNLIIVEWAGNVEEILPENTKKLNLSVLDEETREII